MTKAKNISVEIDIPPSVNNLYYSVSYQDSSGKSRCRRVMTDEGKTYKAVVGYIVKGEAQRKGWKYDNERIKMSLLLIFKDRRRRDITNCIKAVEDAAAEVLGFDDTVVDDFHVHRGRVDKSNPRAYLTVSVITP